MNSIELLKAAVEHEGSMSKVGDKIGYSKATISLILRNEYPAENVKFDKKLHDTYGFLLERTVLCPALKDNIHFEVCKRYVNAVNENKPLSGNMFAIVKDVCPFCPNSQRV
ncbi:hypothetical protein [Sulfurospirillum cavolei]|uniref:hypothetical protein n=1 Tax=Sulfurospirillum cavolei TaxID=366522 RepID=UPI0005A7C99A|nr:hypothetical protein [Sulfurospirillum cavolei]